MISIIINQYKGIKQFSTSLIKRKYLLKKRYSIIIIIYHTKSFLQDLMLKMNPYYHLIDYAYLSMNH